MFGCEAAVKHTLLESENSKYLGTDDGMINVGLMTKLYHKVAHNLNKARKARDGNKKGKTPKEPKKLKVGAQHTCQRSHIKSIPTKIPRLLHSRTFRKEPGRDQGQPRSHNQGTL